MRKRMVLLLLGICMALPLAADQKPPVIYFGGQPLFAGMSRSAAIAALSMCCELSPPADAEDEKLSAETGRMTGHFILSREAAQHRMLGSIFFVDGKVARITRPLDEDKFDAGSDDAVMLARALDRNLASEAADGSDAVVFVSTRHERLSNGESEVVSFRFPNGRSLQLEIVTLDTPSMLTGKRDSVGLDEVLEPAR